jgi:hypothetical protein
MRGFASALFVLLLLGGCGKGKADRPVARSPQSDVPRDQADAEELGKEIFELVDRAVDYKGSHRGRPAASFRQMGIDSLTSTTVRRLVNVGLDPLITVEFRKSETREITSCRGDPQVLEDAAINGGRFSVMCITRSGAQRLMHVGQSDSDH